MTYSVAYTPGARHDLAQVERYLGERFSEKNAEKYVQRILSSCESLGLAPFRGQSFENLRPGMRMVGFEKRINILFVIEGKVVSILGVFYGGQTVEFDR